MSFKIHTCDGLTTRLELEDEEQAKKWLEHSKDPIFQDSITGITIIQKCKGHFKCPSCKRTSKLICSNCGYSKETTCGNGKQYTISKPNGFDKIFYHVESLEAEGKMKGGERVSCFVGNVKISLMVHNSQSSARITLSNIGKQRFNPYV